MAELYLAIQRSMAGFEKLVVIKRILPPLGRDQQFVHMLLHEARVAATLSHPNIVAVFDVGEVDGTHYIAMEHVHGEDLRSIIRQMRAAQMPAFPFEHALAIVLGICGGLAYAHEKKDLDGRPLHIVHRDISPQNTVVTFSGDVKIVDFGIAKSEVGSAEDTGSGKLKGKVPYMSPEQACGEPLDQRSDIFSTGIILFELTTGRRLFKGASDYETLKLICDREVPPPSVVCEDYPVELERIVMKALAKKKDARYATAREMRADLEEFVRAERVRVSPLALSEFMHLLFAEKLESPELTLVAGRQIADSIARELVAPRAIEGGQEHARPTEVGGDSHGQLVKSMPAMLAASRSMRPPPKASSLGIAALAALVLVGSGATTWWIREKSQASSDGADVASPARGHGRGALYVVSNPPGATLWIDGDARPERTPARVPSLPAGRPLEVKLTKEGFEQSRQVVTITADAETAIDATLKQGAVTVEVNAKPTPGLSLSIDDRTVDAAGPGWFVVSDLGADTPHRLLLEAPGYSAHTVTFRGAAFETKRFDVTLEKAAPGSAAANALRAAPPGAVLHRAPAATGKLNIGTNGGWCDVTIDGSPRGVTPLAGLELSAGAHRVTCSTPEGHTQAAVVVVSPESTTRYKFTLP
jgi:serine/threonine-protein kinase